MRDVVGALNATHPDASSTRWIDAPSLPARRGPARHGAARLLGADVWNGTE